MHGGMIKFEPSIKGCVIQPWCPSDVRSGLPEQSSLSVEIPASNQTVKHAIFLRPGDVISFDLHDATLGVTFHHDKTDPLVEVKSSEPTGQVGDSVDVNGHIEDDAETDDDDLDTKPIDNDIEDQSTPNNYRRSPSTQGQPFSTARTAQQLVPETPSVVGHRMTQHATESHAASRHGSEDEPAEHAVSNAAPQLLMPSHAQTSPTPNVPVIPSSAPEMEEGPKPDDHEGVHHAVSPPAQDIPVDEDDEELPDVHQVLSGSVSKKRTIAEASSDSELPKSARTSTARKRQKSSHQTSVSTSKSRRKTPTTHDSPTPSRDSAAVVQQLNGDRPNQYAGEPPRILFSNTDVDTRVALTKFLTANNASRSDRITRTGANFLCVGKGELKTTAKLLTSLVYKRQIVVDSWILDSHKAGYLLQTENYVPEALSSSINADRTKIFSGHIVYFTQALRKGYETGFTDIQKVLNDAGVEETAVKSARDIPDKSQALILGLESRDIDAVSLLDRGFTVYKKELISASIMEAKLLKGDEELLIKPKDKGAGKTSNMGKKRKAN